MSNEKRQPWMRFFSADWRGDAGLRAVGYAARGLWIDMISLMHEATPYGHLVVNDKPLDAARLAARLGGSAKEVQALLLRLEEEGVFSRTDDGVIFSRRMVADFAKSQRDKVNGSGGGNPALKRNPSDNVVDMLGVNPPDNAKDKAHARTDTHVPETREQRLEAEDPEAKEEESRSLRSLVRSEPRSKAAKADADFAAFYAAYPRKQQPDDGLKAWRQVLARGVDPAEIMAGLAQHEFTDEARFIPLPASWLRAGSWKDERISHQPQMTMLDRVRRDLGLDAPLTIDHQELPYGITH